MQIFLFKYSYQAYYLSLITLTQLLKPSVLLFRSLLILLFQLLLVLLFKFLLLLLLKPLYSINIYTKKIKHY